MNKEEIKKLNFANNVTKIADDLIKCKDKSNTPVLLSLITSEFYNETNDKLQLILSVCGLVLYQDLMLETCKDKEQRIEQIIAMYEKRIVENKGELQ